MGSGDRPLRSFLLRQIKVRFNRTFFGPTPNVYLLEHGLIPELVKRVGQTLQRIADTCPLRPFLLRQSGVQFTCTPLTFFTVLIAPPLESRYSRITMARWLG